MRVCLAIISLFVATRAFGDASVVASVDRNRIGFGESVALTITIQGVQNVAPPAIPKVDGLAFDGPATQQNVSWVNGQVSRALSLVYQVTPSRDGEFVIPAIAVAADGRAYRTEPIKIVVEKGAVQTEMSQKVFLRVQMASQQAYLGQVSPVNVLIFARADVPLKGFGGFTCEADGLGYKYQSNLKSGTHVLDGVTYNVHVIEGAITPARVGKLMFGPCVVKGQLAFEKRGGGGGDLFERFFGRVEVRELPLTLDPIPIEVLPLPEEGRPVDFSGAVGQWNLEVTAKPTEVAVGDPITLTIKVSGIGNIDLVPTPKLSGLEEFKTYDPTTKTTKNELNTTGERVIQQVLVPRSTVTKQLPEVRLTYFDPVAKAYKSAVQPAIPLTVKAGSDRQTTIVSGGMRLRPEEKLGQDIVYLKGDLGPVQSRPFCGTALFWALNLAPALALLGGFGWKRRADKLRGNVAYARRSRAARNARKLLSAATGCEQVQHALQAYLGDRLNIPASGITASVADERQLPVAVREIFEACDAARFAGASADLAALKQSVERVIDELENATL